MQSALVFEDDSIKSIDDCRDIDTCKGALGKVFELLRFNLKQKRGTTKKMLMEVGGTEAAKRAREIRLGFYTQNTKKRGEVLWVKYDNSSEFYWLESIKWEEWLRRHHESQRPEAQLKLIDSQAVRTINH